MALEQLINNGTTQLDEAVDDTTDPVTFDVVDGDVFPSAGNFRVKVDDEIMLCTSRTVDSLTCTRAQESTVIAAHDSGATIRFTLTKVSLQNVIADFNLFGAYADRPAAGQRGRVYTPSDYIGVKYYDDGSAWKSILPNGQIVVPPLTTDLPNWQNQETATLTNPQSGVLRLTDPGAAVNEDIRFAYVATTAATTITLTAAIVLHASPQDTVMWGLAFGDGTKITLCGFMQRENQDRINSIIFYYTDPNTYGSVGIEDSVQAYQIPIWLKAHWVVGTEVVTLDFSFDGTTWSRCATLTPTGMGAITRIGIFLNNFNSLTGRDVHADFLHFSKIET